MAVYPEALLLCISSLCLLSLNLSISNYIYKFLYSVSYLMCLASVSDAVTSPTPALSLSGKRYFHPRICSWPQPSLAFVGFNWELHLTKCPTLPLLWKLLGSQGEGTGSLGLSGPEFVVVVSALSALSSRLLDPGSILPWVSGAYGVGLLSDFCLF